MHLPTGRAITSYQGQECRLHQSLRLTSSIFSDIERTIRQIFLFVCLLVLFILYLFLIFFFLMNHFPFRIKLKYLQRLVAQMVKNLSSMLDIRVWSLGWDNPLEKWMATHSSILAWRIPWAEDPGGLQSMGSQSWTQLSDQHTQTHLLLHSAISRGWPTLSW